MSVAATPQWLEMRRLEVMETLGRNKNTVFFPFGSQEAALNMRTLQAVQALDKRQGGHTYGRPLSGAIQALLTRWRG